MPRTFVAGGRRPTFGFMAGSRPERRFVVLRCTTTRAEIHELAAGVIVPACSVCVPVGLGPKALADDALGTLADALVRFLQAEG